MGKIIDFQKEKEKIEKEKNKFKPIEKPQEKEEQEESVDRPLTIEEEMYLDENGPKLN